jgi:signal recognition particle GTPase
MNNNEFESLTSEINNFKNSLNNEAVKKLDLDLLERIIKRLISFSVECEECKKILGELESYINEIKNKQGNFEKDDYKQYNDKIQLIIAHLQKSHKLITEGYYLSVFMCLGLSIGLLFGLTIFDNIGIGMPIGMALGVAVGASVDADTKKKGLVI